ncbi:MAG TPA: LapA family protein [Acidimicrobiales bacterium]|jgi:uncharacterized integral membrane protein
MATNVDNSTEKKIRAAQTARTLVLVAVAAVLVAWAFANQDEVEVDWLLATTSGPLVVVILVSAGLGLVIGMLIGWRRRS